MSHRSLEAAARRIHLDTMAPRQRQRIDLAQGALTYLDSRLKDFDTATLIEVIEHLDPPRLGALERAVFGYAQPHTVIVTTPNREYNALFPGLAAGSMRHRDHRFEWSREEFGQWTEQVADRFGYSVQTSGIGPVDDSLGAPTQMAVFTREKSG